MPNHPDPHSQQIHANDASSGASPKPTASSKPTVGGSRAWKHKAARSAFERMRNDLLEEGCFSDECKRSFNSCGAPPKAITLLAREFHGREAQIMQPKRGSRAEPLFPTLEDAVYGLAGEGGVHSFHDGCAASGSDFARVYRSGCEHICFKRDLESEFSDTQKWKIVGQLGGAGRTHLYETNGPHSIKLIIRAEKRARFFERLYARARGFPVEEPLGYRMIGTFDTERIGYVFTSFVENGISLDEGNLSRIPREERQEISSMIVDLLVRMHNEDIAHTHPHNGNFIYIPNEKRIVMIDSPYNFGEDARATRIDMLLYFLLRASAQPTIKEHNDYWHILRSVRLVELGDIDRLMRQYLTSSIIDYREMHREAQRLTYGVHIRHMFEYLHQIHSLDGAVKYLMERMWFLQQCLLHW